MSVRIGDTAPNFEADTSLGKIKFHEWIGDSWAILFSHPADFTPVCTTELGSVASYQEEFAKRGVKVIALSVDSADSHREWIKDVNAHNSVKVEYPIIADLDRKVAEAFGMLDQTELDSKGMPLTCRGVFIIDPKKKVRLSIFYPASCGRNFDEIIRVVDSLQLTDGKRVATPQGWKQGDDVIILPNVSAEDAAKEYPEHRTSELPSGKGYLRYTPLKK